MKYYFILTITLVAVASSYGSNNQATDSQQLSRGDSTEIRLTKYLNMELEGELNKVYAGLQRAILPEVELGIRNEAKAGPLEEVITILRELQSEIAILKNNASDSSNLPKSDCFLQSNIFEGKSFPIGVNYQRTCKPKVLLREEPKQTFPTSCKEIQKNGITTSGIYQIQPKNSKKSLMVLCDMETQGGGWTHIQKRYDGSVDFNLGWREYKFGFGDLGSEFWLGLENIYQITGSEVNELLVEIVDREDKTAYAHYKKFAIGPEPGGYTLNTLSGFSGNAGDSLTAQFGMKFTTKDLDRDAWDSGNCATTRGAWWYKACYSSNLNSLYINADLPPSHVLGGLQWETFGPYNYCHAKSRMMVRPAV